MKARLSLIASAWLVFALAAVLAHAQATTRFDPRRDPAADVAQAVATAQAQGKRVLVDVGGEWCSWCHILDRFFEADAEARALRDRGFVMVKVNYSRENRNERFLSRWPRVAGYPHLFVLGPDGSLLHSQDTGALERGNGYDRAKMLAFLRRWSPPSRSARRRAGALPRKRPGHMLANQR